MGKQLHAQTEIESSRPTAGARLTLNLEQQCLQILRCTARALANSPGGLRFKAGSKPWLDALTDCRGDLNFSAQHGA